jgi:hypothetical protein
MGDRFMGNMIISKGNMLISNPPSDSKSKG